MDENQEAKLFAELESNVSIKTEQDAPWNIALQVDTGREVESLKLLPLDSDINIGDLGATYFTETPNEDLLTIMNDPIRQPYIRVYSGDPRFLALLDDMRKMHAAKSAGYAGIDNPDVFANFRRCEELGIPAFLGAFIRKMDKDSRGRNLIANPMNEMLREGLEDTLFDSASYDLIVKLLFEEDKERNIRFLEDLYELNRQLDIEFPRMDK